ncbi:MAG TPA: hypothetical protein VIZ21_01365, partial [Ignavibacteriaceae bacterium]
RRKLLQQSYFDYSGKEISDHFQRISGEIKKNKKISFDDLKKLIIQAVSFNANYLVRPRWSLTKLIFNEQPIISVEELQMMLNYLYYYEYFRKVLSAYLSKRKLVQISLAEFDLILNKIDSELFSSSQEQLVENALKSMGDFFNIGGVDKNLVSSSAIEVFLKEKNMLELVFKLRKEVPEGQKKRYDKNDLKRIFYSTASEGKSEKITITDSEIVIDGQESLNEESKKTNLEELAGKYAEEMDKTDVESFLSPEEEETLLSLYDEELKELIEETDSEIPENEFGMKKSDLEDKEETLFEQDSEESEFLAGEDLTSTKSIESESISEEIPELETDEFPDQIEIESESENEGIEKEIVDEMIRDFIGEEKSSESIDETSKNVFKKDKETSDAEFPDIETLENELLNIFDDVDKYNAGVPSEEISFEEVKEIPDDNVNQAKDLFSPFLEEDGLDDYINSLDEIVSSDKKNKPIVDEIKKEIIDEKPEPPMPVAVEERVVVEKKVNEEEKVSRVIRPKDLFSYLRRKEVKKIVSFIFANDEEDFTNTIERLMDCHSYKEASEILKAVFTSYKISPYSKEAITFTNAVSNYFRQA